MNIDSFQVHHSSVEDLDAVVDFDAVEDLDSVEDERTGLVPSRQEASGQAGSS